MSLIVEIKLVQVNFVPTWYTVGDNGKPVSSKRTAVGQLAFDCAYLPAPLAAKLRELIAGQFQEK